MGRNFFQKVSPHRSYMKKIVILGSTGSVGRQTVEVAVDTDTKVLTLTGNRNVRTMEAQARLCRPNTVVMSDKSAAADLKIRLADTDISVETGKTAMLEAAANEEADVIFNSVGQSAGLEPTLDAVNAGKCVALANKESIVMAGKIVMDTAKKNHARIIPVDSEHSAIFQCLQNGTDIIPTAVSNADRIRRILLTASGGPFFGKKRSELADITPEQALAHPTWNMGAKITIDSATLMNKGFEVIEAVHLFGVRPEQVEVVVHRESIIHSMVEYPDNAVIAQLSLPDMRLCAQYALTYPKRIGGLMKPLDFTALGHLSFYKPDTEAFPLLRLAYDCIREGGVLPAVLTYADEVAVSQYTDGFIGFTDIFDVVETTVARCKNIAEPTLEDIRAACDTAFLEAAALCKGLH